MKNYWNMNKIGLFDFWYYDEQEFDFSDGRMLLRGANGCGKSVTMQSFIPMILDGNISPERIDPFGTKNRKISSYLLEEDDERNERIGYLYMEFKRKNSETYFTIGMGIRAVKGKNIEKWYFYINDNRRINKEIFLYSKKAEGKVSFSRRELENKIGEGGKVILKREDYIFEVNKFLFGFSKVEYFKELTDLLIKLRTPKLSKDFKPSDLSDLLTDSLKELGEDELRDLSNVIENIDSIENRIQELENAKKEAEKIVGLYDRYNHKVLYDKASQLLEVMNLKIKKENERERKIAELDNGNSSLKEYNQHLDEVEKEKLRIAERLKISKIDNIETLKAEYDKIIEEKNEKEDEFKKKRQEEKNNVEREKRLERTIKEIKEEKEKEFEKVFETLGTLSEFSEKGRFIEHNDFENNFRKGYDNVYDFTYIIDVAEKRYQKAKIVNNDFEKYNKERDNFEEENNKLEKKQSDRENLLKEIEENKEKQLRKAQEKIDDINIWENDNKELKLCQKDREKIFNYINHLNEYKFIHFIQDIINDTAKEKKLFIDKSDIEIANNINELNEILINKKYELEEVIKNGELLEISQEVKKSRERLIQENIEFSPLYEVIDFQEGLQECQADAIEEALYRMGILEAIVVESKYKERILKNKEYLCDKFIFADKENNSFDNILFPQSNNIDLNKILFNKCDGSIYINDEGVYKLGEITGIISGEYKAKFVGEERRKKYRENKINLLKEEIIDLEGRINFQKNILIENKNKRETIENEKNGFGEINLDELVQFVSDRKGLESKLETLENEIKEMFDIVKELQESLNKSASKLKEEVEEINCSFNYEMVKECYEAMSDYAEDIKNLNVTHKAYITQKECEKSNQNQLDEVRFELENEIRYKIIEFEKKIAQLDKKLAEYKKVFEEKGVKEQIQNIENDRKREKQLAEYKNKVNIEIAICKEKLKEYKKDIVSLNEEIERIMKEENYYHKVFWEEKMLCLTALEPNEEENENLYDFAVRTCEEIKRNYNKIDSDNQNSMANDIVGRIGGCTALAEFNIKKVDKFTDVALLKTKDYVKRIDVRARYNNADVNIKQFYESLIANLEIEKMLLDEEDKKLFENILINDISQKIVDKIKYAKEWVDKINNSIEQMDTSSGLTFSIKWADKKSENDEQIDISELVGLLEKDKELIKENDREKIINHFKNMVKSTRRLLDEKNEIQSYMGAMKKVLDYRQWYEFQLFYKKPGEKKKTLTDAEFYKFSGGEKAMSMYVPLFAAVSAKYDACDKDAPRIIALDEAFAGVDDKNIRDMFRLITDFKFGFIINSQILWGDCDTLPSLSIYELYRPSNRDYISTMRYIWNGFRRENKNEM